MSEHIFAEGFYFKRPENAPEWKVGQMGIDVQRAIKWLERQPTSERGYVNVQILRSRSGDRYYLELDTWQPTPQQREPARTQRDPEPIDDLDGDIPF